MSVGYARATMGPKRHGGFSRAAWALLERMRRTPAGWSSRDLARLYQGFGFVKRDTGDHTVYYHPVHREVRATVPRGRSLKSWVARDAVSVVDRLVSLEERRHDKGS